MYQPERNTQSFLSQWIPYQAGGGYRYFTGSLAFVLHRVSGIALIVYLILHIISITKAGQMDPTHYDVVMRRFQEPDFKVGEIALWAAVLFHGINGLRILLVDFVLERSHVSKHLFWCFGALIAVLLIVGAIPLVLHSNVQPVVFAGGN
ncbi:MAG: succinate dehydrogenase, cytochrome b556 subunit [Planctomycetota bacterium]|jgi:succinate dehydrogenase / fumarate reductase cytochrome b subunit|nr:succinate dehydrogenase, cytochrome b556 subunit [Planctomycetota bacterium]